MQSGTDPVAGLIDEWQAARRALRETEQRMHPAVIDALGREWTWRNSDLYVHDGMAWPREWIMREDIGRPTESALTNPNYAFCDICQGRATTMQYVYRYQEQSSDQPIMVGPFPTEADAVNAAGAEYFGGDVLALVTPDELTTMQRDAEGRL